MMRNRFLPKSSSAGQPRLGDSLRHRGVAIPSLPAAWLARAAPRVSGYGGWDAVRKGDPLSADSFALAGRRSKRRKGHRGITQTEESFGEMHRSDTLEGRERTAWQVNPENLRALNFAFVVPLCDDAIRHPPAIDDDLVGHICARPVHSASRILEIDHKPHRHRGDLDSLLAGATAIVTPDLSPQFVEPVADKGVPLVWRTKRPGLLSEHARHFVTNLTQCGYDLDLSGSWNPRHQKARLRSLTERPMTRECARRCPRLPLRPSPRPCVLQGSAVSPSCAGRASLPRARSSPHRAFNRRRPENERSGNADASSDLRARRISAPGFDFAPCAAVHAATWKNPRSRA
jgi:hypothetical protein